MAKKKRVRRSKQDLIQELDNQVSLLIHACESFDKGLELTGKQMAGIFRLLFHHQGQSRALLEQLQLRQKRFLDTAGNLSDGNIMAECRLCSQLLSTDTESKYIPFLSQAPWPSRWLRFEEWWNNKIIKDNRGRKFSRRELILHIAETDGSAHVDPELPADYMDLSRNNSLGWVISDGSTDRPFPPPVMPCMRQISHEVLETLKIKAQDIVRVPYGQSEDSVL